MNFLKFSLFFFLFFIFHFHSTFAEQQIERIDIEDDLPPPPPVPPVHYDCSVDSQEEACSSPTFSTSSFPKVDASFRRFSEITPKYIKVYHLDKPYYFEASKIKSIEDLSGSLFEKVHELDTQTYPFSNNIQYTKVGDEDPRKNFEFYSPIGVPISNSLVELFQLGSREEVEDEAEFQRFFPNEQEEEKAEGKETVKKIVLAIVAVEKGALFMWPARKLGYESHILVDGRNITVRTASVSPKAFQIENLFGDEEIEGIKAYVSGKMEPSRVGNSAAGAEYSPGARTSSQTWIFLNFNKVADSLMNRIATLTSIPVNFGEGLQVVHYGVGQYFFAHLDAFDPREAPDNPYLAAGGNRLVTVLVYFNDVEEGGATVFPNTNAEYAAGKNTPGIECEKDFKSFRTEARKGKATMFYNLVEKGMMNGNIDTMSLHAGCTVSKGEKWAANLWLRNKRVNGMLINDYY